MTRFAAYTDVSAANADLESRLTALTATLRNAHVFDVKSATYGAVGDGVADDRAAIQAAIDACIAAGGGIVTGPRGTYAFTTYASGYTDRILRLANSGSAVTVSLIFPKGTIFTTGLNTNVNSSVTATLFLSGNLEDCVIDGIDFRNTHGLTAGRTCAIYTSEATNSIKRLTIRNNVFRNHARTIQLEGVETAMVRDNAFLFTAGRDSGNTNLADPNVCIYALANSANGQTSNVSVIDNYLDGCTSGDVSANTNKQGLDGMVYGTARGWVIRGNKGKRWGVEFIYPSSRQAYEATRYPCIIEGNEGDGTLPTGAAQSVFGVRSDEHDTKSANNSFTNVQFGIDINGSGRAVPLEGCSSTNDSVTLTGTTQDCYGIQVNTCNAPTVHGTKVQWAATPGTTGTALYGVKLFQANRALVSDVRVVSPALPSAGTLYGCYVQQSHSGRFHDITAEYCTYALFEYQHTTAQPGHRLARIAGRNCTTLIGGATADTDQMVVEGFDNPMSADNGDASVTLRGPAVPIQRFDTALTANRTVTLTLIDSSGQSYGKWFRIVRTGLGAFTLTVQDSNAVVLKAIPAGTAAAVECYFNGTAWKLVSYELL